MLPIFLALLVAVNGQGCLRANNPLGLPPFMDYKNSDLRSEIIPELHQAIIPSYRFICCGNITEWGVDVSPAGRNHNRIYNLDLQVWRPSPTVQTTGCYSLVRNNRFTSVPLANQVAVVTPLPREQIEFQPGDVLGFNLENTDGDDGGVVILMDSSEQGDGGYETEEVWYADFSNPVFGSGECQLVVGSQPGRILNTLISAAPIISASYRITQCPTNIMPTTLPAPPSQPILMEPNPVTSLDKVTDSMLDQSGTEENVLNNGSDPFVNTGLIIGIVAAALMVITIIRLTAVLGFIIVYKKQKKEASTATNMAYDTALHDTAVNTEGDTYDSPSMDNRYQAQSSSDTKMNKAYATNAEAKLCIAYGNNITTERNVAYGIKLHDVVTCGEGDTYDYPTMDS